MFKFGHIDMEKESNPIIWDKVSKDDFNLLMKCKNFCMSSAVHTLGETFMKYAVAQETC